MSIAIQSVLAIVVVVFFGFYASKTGMVSNKLSSTFSTLVMQFTFPAVLFTSLATTSVDHLLNFKFILTFFLALMVMYAVIGTLSRYVFKRSTHTSAMIAFACSFPNMAFMGIPYLEEILGKGSLLSVAIGNVITSVIMIPLTIVFLEQSEQSVAVIDIFKSEFIKLLKKPIIVAPVLGIIVALLQIPVPKFLLHGLTLLGSATSPIALFTLGLLMTKFRFKFSMDVAVIVILKLIAQPLVAVGFIMLCGLKGDFSAEIIILTAMPTAIIVSIFAEKYEIYQEETVSAIIASNVVSIASLVFFTTIAERFIA